jgi:hypothetical protein
MSLFSLIISFKILLLRFILSFIAAFISTMTALLARFFTGTTRGDPSQGGPTRQTCAIEAESARKLRKSHSTTVKARKSITSLFGFSVKLTSSDDRFVKILREHGTSNQNSRHEALIHTRATCQEAQHYPIYDPTNPEHDPSAVPTENPQSPRSSKRDSSSSAKFSGRKQSPSPRKHPASARARNRLQGFADTLRAKASVFYDQQNSSEEDLMPDAASTPSTPHSAKSVCCKKSVTFRSGHSIIGNTLSHTSPIAIPRNSPPSLSMVNISSTPVFDTTSAEEKDLGLTARPQETVPVHIVSRPSPQNTSRSELSLKLDDEIGITSALPTPMPGTNLPFDDLFDDAAATLIAENPISKISAGRIASDQGYIADKESTTQVNDIDDAHMSQTRISCAQSTIDPSPADKKSSITGSTSLVNDSGENSPSNSPSRAQRALRRMHAFPPKFKMRPRLPSEMPQYPDDKRSDGNEVQQEPMISRNEDDNLAHESGRDDINIVEDSEFGVDLFRCKTPNRDPAVELATITHAIHGRPSSDEIEKANASIALEVLGTQGSRVQSAASPSFSTPQRVGPALRGVENADPVHFEESTKVCK